MKRLDFERFSIAFRVMALAGQFGRPFRIGTYIAAVILSGRSRTVAGGVFAFLCRGHESSPFIWTCLLSCEGSAMRDYARQPGLRRPSDF
jgi:hypothetical protein